MKLTIDLPLKAISLNSATAVFQNGRRASSKKYNYFRKDTSEILAAYSKELHDFAKHFDIEKHAFGVKYTFGLENVILKSGKGINRKSLDADNMIKPINDIIFSHLARYNSNIDDSQVLSVLSRKRQAESAYINVQMVIVNFATYFNNLA